MADEVTVSSENFEAEVLKADIPVLIDFWAEWCMPCKMIAPALSELAEKYAGKVKLAKLNVDEESELAAQYNIISIPTLLMFKGGEVVRQHVGAAPKPTLEGIFKEFA